MKKIILSILVLLLLVGAMAENNINYDSLNSVDDWNKYLSSEQLPDLDWSKISEDGMSSFAKKIGNEKLDLNFKEGDVNIEKIKGDDGKENIILKNGDDTLDLSIFKGQEVTVKSTKNGFQISYGDVKDVKLNGLTDNLDFTEKGFQIDGSDITLASNSELTFFNTNDNKKGFKYKGINILPQGGSIDLTTDSIKTTGKVTLGNIGTTKDDLIIKKGSAELMLNDGNHILKSTSDDTSFSYRNIDVTPGVKGHKTYLYDVIKTDRSILSNMPKNSLIISSKNIPELNIPGITLPQKANFVIGFGDTNSIKLGTNEYNFKKGKIYANRQNINTKYSGETTMLLAGGGLTAGSSPFSVGILKGVISAKNINVNNVENLLKNEGLTFDDIVNIKSEGYQLQHGQDAQVKSVFDGVSIATTSQYDGAKITRSIITQKNQPQKTEYEKRLEKISSAITSTGNTLSKARLTYAKYDYLNNPTEETFKKFQDVFNDVKNKATIASTVKNNLGEDNWKLATNTYQNVIAGKGKVEILGKEYDLTKLHTTYKNMFNENPQSSIKERIDTAKVLRSFSKNLGNEDALPMAMAGVEKLSKDELKQLKDLKNPVSLTEPTKLFNRYQLLIKAQNQMKYEKLMNDKFSDEGKQILQTFADPETIKGLKEQLDVLPMYVPIVSKFVDAGIDSVGLDEIHEDAKNALDIGYNPTNLFKLDEISKQYNIPYEDLENPVVQDIISKSTYLEKPRTITLDNKALLDHQKEYNTKRIIFNTKFGAIKFSNFKEKQNGKYDVTIEAESDPIINDFYSLYLPNARAKQFTQSQQEHLISKLVPEGYKQNELINLFQKMQTQKYIESKDIRNLADASQIRGLTFIQGAEDKFLPKDDLATFQKYQDNPFLKRGILANLMTNLDSLNSMDLHAPDISAVSFIKNLFK